MFDTNLPKNYNYVLITYNIIIHKSSNYLYAYFPTPKVP